MTNEQILSKYNRDNPSPRYRELLALYRRMHREGDGGHRRPPQKMFPGESLIPHAETIKKIIDRVSASTVLDYGSGKGQQYTGEKRLPGGERISSVKDFWGVRSIVCYDPAYPPFDRLPSESFDGVVSTDVLEHCPQEDVAWIIEEMFARAKKFVYFNVACFPAVKTLPNGENAHCTVQKKDWWLGIIKPIAARYPQVYYEAVFQEAPARAPASGPGFLQKSFRLIRERRLPIRVTNALAGWKARFSAKNNLKEGP